MYMGILEWKSERHQIKKRMMKTVVMTSNKVITKSYSLSAASIRPSRTSFGSSEESIKTLIRMKYDPLSRCFGVTELQLSP